MSYRVMPISLLVLAFVGCGGEEQAYLSGKVTLNGEPVGPGVISLAPLDETRPGAMAYFGEDGQYSVMSSGRKEGAPPGEYRVTIKGGTAEELTTEAAGPRPKSKIPPRYAIPGGSDLTVTIEPGTNTKDFTLTP